MGCLSIVLVLMNIFKMSLLIPSGFSKCSIQIYLKNTKQPDYYNLSDMY